MDGEIVDGWTLVHGSVGAMTFLVGVPLWLGVVGHQIHELFENSKEGIKFWNKWYPNYKGDTAQNSAADTLGFTMGYMIAKEIKKK